MDFGEVLKDFLKAVVRVQGFVSCYGVCLEVQNHVQNNMEFGVIVRVV